MLQKFQSLAQSLKSTNGRLEKEAFLLEYAEDAEVKRILHFLYNPYIVSGISDKKLNKFRNIEPLPLLGTDAPAFGEMLDYFQKNNTGRDEDIVYLVTSAKLAADGNDELLELIYGIIKKDLKLGTQATTLNKVYGGGFIPTFELMLAYPYADYATHAEGKEFILTEKLDGVRCVLIFNDSGLPNFFSRQGQTFNKLVELEMEVAPLDKKFVYDGELLLDNTANLHSKDLYRETVKITNADSEKRGIVFHIFDKILKEDFQKGKSNEPCAKRKESLGAELGNLHAPHIAYVTPLYIGNETPKIFEHLDKMTAKGGEGVMLNIADAPYECKRSKNLLKVKMFQTADVLVERLEEGTGRNRGKLGAVWVRFIGPDGEFYTCKVGSGFSDSEREHFWQNRTEIDGKIIEIGYFELSQNQKDNKYSMRFPTFKHVRNDKTEISMN